MIRGALLLGLLVASCSLPTRPTLRTGQTLEEVQAALGEPRRVLWRTQREALVVWSLSYWVGPHTTASGAWHLLFRDGRLAWWVEYPGPW